MELDTNNIGPIRTRTLDEIIGDLSGSRAAPVTSQPTQEFNLHQISDDPNAPLVQIPKTFSPEQVEEYLQSDELAAQIFNQGYLYFPGVPTSQRPAARKIEALTMEEKGDFKRGAEPIFGILKQIIPTAKATFADIIGNEEMQQEANRVIRQYAMDSQAKQFFTTPDGEVKYYEQSLEDIFKSGDEGKLGDFIDYLQYGGGMMAASAIPAVVAAIATYFSGGRVAPLLAQAAANSVAFGYPLVYEKQLEETEDPNLVYTLAGGTVFGAVESVLGTPSRFFTGAMKKKLGEEVVDGWAKRFIKGGFKSGVLEATAEVTQDSIVETAGAAERVKSLKDLPQELSTVFADKQIQKNLREAGYMGFAGGFLFGGPASVITGSKAKQAYEASRKFDGKSQSITSTNFNDPEVEQYLDKKVTLSNVTELKDKDGNTLVDSDGNPITPTFIVLGTTDIDGEKHVTLLNTSDKPNDIPSLTIPAKDAPNLINIYEEPKPVEKTEVIEEAIPEGPTVTPSQQAQKEKRKLIGVTPEQAEAIQADMRKGMSFNEAVAKNAPGAAYTTFNTTKPNKPAEIEAKEEPETFVSYNKNQVNAAERRLSQRGFPKKVLNDIKKDKNAADDIMSLDSDEANYIDDLRADLEKLNYYRGPEGIAKIDSLQADVAKGKRGKTRGRELLEDIVKNKIAFEPVQITNKYRTGETVVPPLSKNELKTAGYSVTPLKYLKADYERDIANSNAELSQTTDPNQKEIIQNRIRYLNSLYNISNKPLRNRYDQLKAMISGKGYLFRDKQINQIKDLPAELRGVQQAIEGTTNNPFIQPTEKAIALNDLNKRLNNILQDKSDFDTLLISLGADDVFTLNDLAKVSMSSPEIKKITQDVLGKTIPKFEKETTMMWSLQGPSPKMTNEFKGDLPKLRQQLTNELERLMGLDSTDLKILNEFLTNTGEALNGGFLVDFATIDVVTRMRTIATLMNTGIPFDKARLIVPQVVPQNKIIISTNPNEPFAVELKQDPRLFTLHHETMHALLMNGFFTTEEVKILKEAAKKYWIKQYDISNRPGAEKLTQEQLEEEAIANAFAGYLAKKYQPRGRIATLLYRLKAYFNALANVLFNNTYTDANRIFEEVDLGNVKKRKYDTEIQNSIDLSYKNAASIAQKKIKELRKELETSAVKGGTAENVGLIGVSTQNKAANLYINSPIIRNTITDISNKMSIYASPELGLAILKIQSYINHLTGNQNATGIPTGDDIIQLDSLITDIRRLLREIDYTNFERPVPSLMAGAARANLDESLERLIKTLTTPQQRDAVSILRDLIYTNSYQEKRVNDTQRLATIDKLNNLYYQRLTEQNVALANSPVIMYHGTDREFERFSKYRDYKYHVGTEGTAQIVLRGKAPKIMKRLFVNIKNPVRMKDIGTWDAQDILDNLDMSLDTRGKNTFTTKDGMFVTDEMESAVTDPNGVVDYSIVNVVSQKIFTGEEGAFLNDVLNGEGVYQSKDKKLEVDIGYITAKYKNLKEKELKKADPNNEDSVARTNQQIAFLNLEEEAEVELAKDQIITQAIKDKGYDGIVYINTNEASSLEGGPRDSYIAFDGDQLINIKEIPAQNDLGNPLFKASLQMSQDPSATDSTVDEFPELNRQQENQSFRTVSKLIEKYESVYDENSKLDEEQQMEDLGKFNKIISHIRMWSANNPIFTPLYQTVTQREQFSTGLQFQFQKKLNDNFIPAMRDTQTNINITKALEISSQVEGRYRPDRPISEGGRITFIAKQDGKGAGSTLKKGDVVILEGDAAQAYLDVQEVLQTANKEIIRGLLANENIMPMIKFAIGVLKQNRPDLKDVTIGLNDTPVLDYNQEQMENIEYDELKFIVDALKDPATYLQPDGKYEKNLFNTVAKVLSKDVIERAADGSIIEGRKAGTGLNALLNELGIYKKFKQSDYIPLQRYGNYFIAVKDGEGNLLEYRMFNKGKFGTKILDEEANVRKELQNKYPNLDINSFATQKVDIDNLRKGVAADLGHMDSIAQFLSDLNANNYLEVRKELDTLINKKVGADVRGYGVFLRPRKEQGGVPGFSTDFGRAITQYLTVSAGFAGKNRYKSTELRMLNDVKQSDKQNLKEAVSRWYEYSDSPYQEFALPRRLGFWWYLGGNISSALLQMMSVPQFVVSKLSTFSNIPRATLELTKALNDVRKMMAIPFTEKFKNRQLQDIFVDYSEMPQDVKELMLDVANGIYKPGSAFKETGMPTDQANYTSTNKVRNMIRTAENSVMGGLFASFESMARLSAGIATFRLMRDNPKAVKKAHEYFMYDANYRYNVKLNGGKTSPRIIAQHVIAEDFGVYGKTERPPIMRGIGSVVFLFNTYVAQMFSQLYRNMFQRGRLGKEMAAKTLAMITATGGFFAVPGVDDLGWALEFITNTVTGIRRDRRQVWRRYLDEAGWGSGAIEALENGLINKWFDFDLASRTRFNLPGVQQAKAALNLAGLNSGARGEEALGAFGSLIFGNARNIVNKIDSVGGISQVGFGEFFEMATGLMPTFVKNFVASKDYFTGGPIFSSRGTMLIDDPNMYEAFLKGIGFNPTDITKAQNLLYLEQVNGGATSEIRSRFNTRIKNYFREFMLAKDSNDTKEFARLAKVEKEIMNDLIKLNESLKPGLKFVPDIYRLMQEAAKDLNTAYRLSSGSPYELSENLYDYQLLNKGLIPADPN